MHTSLVNNYKKDDQKYLRKNYPELIIVQPYNNPHNFQQKPGRCVSDTSLKISMTCYKKVLQ